MAQLGRVDQATVERARQLLADAANVPAGEYPRLLGRLEIVTADLVAIIENLTGGNQ